VSDVPPVTQDALDRLERTARRELQAHECLANERFIEIRRRLDDLNNSHATAVQEKKATDLAAVQVQERTISRVEFQSWKDEVNRALTSQQATAVARATMLSTAIGIAAVILNLILRYMSGRVTP
jgi:hypothetical protein